MNERLLQFIWQFQYFNKQALRTTQGELLIIEKPGMWNHHQGPDFSAATIRIGTTTWVGNIELHISSSDWYKHEHGGDAHYNNIILHVVWTEDVVIYDGYGNRIPALALESRIPGILLSRYRQMMEAGAAIPCQSFLPALHELGWSAWKERLVAERLERRSALILQSLQRSRYHWEEIFWRLLAANFGLKVNSALFEQVADTLPVVLLARHKNRIHQLEALLLGQANLLQDDPADPYETLLQKEYHFLQLKYQLQPVNKQPAFLRMRPAAFPTIRLAQLATLVSDTTHLFATIREITEVKEVVQQFNVTASEYWNDHYRFHEPSVHKPKKLGVQMAENILINTVVPVLFAYGLYHKEERYKDKAIQWFYRLGAEDNRITRNWQRSGINIRSALDSQALIELTNSYCSAKQCLDCAVGNKILKS